MDGSRRHRLETEVRERKDDEDTNEATSIA